MEIFNIILSVAILLTLFDISDKLKKLMSEKKQNKLNIKEYLNKDVYIVLNNENITDSYLFSSAIKTIGQILDYDDTWFIFKYYDKNTKKYIMQYLKISDLESINEIR